MTRYVISKGLYYLSLLIGVIFVTFVLFHAIPSDPARVILGANASEQEVAVLREKLGLNETLPVQLGRYFERMSTLDLGRSYLDDRPVYKEVTGKLRISLALIGTTLLLTFLYVAISVTLEFIVGIRLVGFLDFVWVSLPSILSAVFLALLAVNYYPFSTFSGHLNSTSDVLFLLPPALALAMYPMAILSRIVRSELRELGKAPFIVAARASGFSKARILGTYMLRNSLVPFLSALASQIPLLFTGALVVELVFSVPGIGSLLLKSLLQRDLPMLEGIVILNGCIVVVIHFALELVYPLIDPRMVVASD
jgi:peptide/nickel transport system permease protein